MSNELDLRTINNPGNVEEVTVLAQPQSELTDDDLSNVSGGGIKVPDLKPTDTPPTDEIIGVL